MQYVSIHALLYMQRLLQCLHRWSQDRSATLVQIHLTSYFSHGVRYYVNCPLQHLHTILCIAGVCSQCCSKLLCVSTCTHVHVLYTHRHYMYMYIHLLEVSKQLHVHVLISIITYMYMYMPIISCHSLNFQQSSPDIIICMCKYISYMAQTGMYCKHSYKGYVSIGSSMSDRRHYALKVSIIPAL